MVLNFHGELSALAPITLVEKFMGGIFRDLQANHKNEHPMKITSYYIYGIATGACRVDYTPAAPVLRPAAASIQPNNKFQ